MKYTDDETAYVNQFFVVRNREVATKHVFAGGTRLVSKMASQPDATPPTAGNSGQAPWGWLHSNAGGNSPNSGGTVFEKDQYYFHPDHLGSSSYVTDIDGEIFQHLEYFPFGETFVEESSNTQRTPYLFTGKELDPETGLYYFGARYYDPRTSIWQSPDPILASYMRGQGSGGGVYAPANLNLYGYVQNKPVVAVDPSGKEMACPLLAPNAMCGFYGGLTDGLVGGLEAINDGDSARAAESLNSMGQNAIDRTIEGAKSDVLGGAGAAGLVAVATKAPWWRIGKWFSRAPKPTVIGGSKGYSSFDVFKGAHGRAGTGNAWHHVVEKQQEWKFGANRIHNTDNLIKLDAATHDTISGYYTSKKQPFTSGLSVREWLSTQSFEAQYEFGMNFMRSIGAID